MNSMTSDKVLAELADRALERIIGKSKNVKVMSFQTSSKLVCGSLLGFSGLWNIPLCGSVQNSATRYFLCLHTYAKSEL